MFFNAFVYISDPEKGVSHAVVNASVGERLWNTAEFLMNDWIPGIKDLGMEMGKKTISRIVSCDKKPFVWKADF